MDFENYYLSKLYSETGEHMTALEKCSAIRNSLGRIHNEGLNSLSNSSTCTILEQRLCDYSQMYHNDKDGAMGKTLDLVDNLLKGKIQTRHCTNWKSKLSSSNVDFKKVLFKSLSENGHCGAHKELPCSADKVDQNGLNKLFKKKIYKTENNKEIEDNSLAFPVRTNSNDKISRTENVKQSVFNGTEKIKSNVPARTFPSFPDFDNDANYFNYNNMNNENIQSNVENSVPKNSHGSSSNNLLENDSCKFFFNLRNSSTQKVSRDNSPSKENKFDSKSNAFKTARTELQIQNVKKYGNNKQMYNNPPEPNMVVKKSLGTTRSSVQNKFIPPLATNSDSQPQSVDEPMEDERLKHIDPKMIEFIRSEIIDSSAPVGWEDIAGLEFAKSAIQEAVVWPLLRPDIFTGLRKPPKGILLFGPPGTGKTLIGKCIASQCSATFFSISASSLTSKWIGDGEKMVRALFAVARCHQPSVVFIDEIDSLLTQRSDTEHEATRRIKTEFLVQLDGAATGDEDRFLVIGATNRPQELDEAARRRLVKRLYIPLPETNARKQIIKRLMRTERHSLTEEDMDNIALKTDGYSGADMKSLCSEAALGPIRAVPLSQISNIHCDQVRPVNTEDFTKALTRVRPSVSGNDLEHYTVWDNTYGSGNSR